MVESNKTCKQKMLDGLLIVTFLFYLLQSLGGCNRLACSGVPPSKDPGAPQLLQLSYLGNTQKDPWSMVLGYHYAVLPNSNFAQGNVLLFASGQSKAQVIPLSALLASSQTDPSGSAGSFALVLDLTEGAVSDGSLIRIETQLQDGQNRLSNCYSMDLLFAVVPNQ